MYTISCVFHFEEILALCLKHNLIQYGIIIVLFVEQAVFKFPGMR